MVLPRKGNGEEQEGARSKWPKCFVQRYAKTKPHLLLGPKYGNGCNNSESQLAAGDSRRGMKSVRERGTRNVRDGEIDKLADNVLSPMARTTKGGGQLIVGVPIVASTIDWLLVVSC